MTTHSDSKADQKRIDAGLIKLGIAVIPGVVVSVMDATMMVVAIDAVSQEFAAPAPTVQWVTSAYLLATCAAIPASGYLVNRFSARTVWLLSLAAFIVASLLCAAAWSVGSLVGFRVGQGLASGLIGMAAVIVLTRAAGPARAGRAFSMVAAPTSLAPVLGPILAGAVVDAVGWRWLFYAKIPLLLVAFIAAWFLLPQDARDRQARLDWGGLLLVAVGLSALVYGLSEVTAARADGLLNTLARPATGGTIAVGVLLCAGFITYALRHRGTSIIDLRLFGDRQFAMTCGLLFVAGFVLYGLLFLIPLYYQQVVGMSATAAGVLLAPQGVGMGLAAIVVGSLSDRFGPRPVVLCGIALTMVGTVPFALAGTEPNGVVMAVFLVLRGIGLTAASIPLAAALYQTGQPKAAYPQIAIASAVVMRLGGAVGAAGAAVMLVIAAPVGMAGGVVPPQAFSTAFWWMTGLLALPIVVALFLPGRRAAEEAAQPQPEGEFTPEERRT